MWILDASDLLDNQKPPEYGGLNVPMFLTSEKIRKGLDELKEINTLKDEIIKRGDPEEIKKTRKRISDLRDSFRGYSVKLQDLDKYVQEGLARPDLTEKDVMELGQLRDDANKATMAVKAAGTLLLAFPE
jgi:DNA repair ATPase RecN